MRLLDLLMLAFKAGVVLPCTVKLRGTVFKTPARNINCSLRKGLFAEGFLWGWVWRAEHVKPKTFNVSIAVFWNNTMRPVPVPLHFFANYAK